MEKKASIEISLSWVFMIIIGSFFLILAYNVIGKYQDIEEEKYNLELKQILRTILNNVGRTSGIEDNSLERLGNIFKNKEVEISCVDDLPILSIDGKSDGSNDFLRNYPVFMTYIEEGSISNSYLAVESFKLPFKITNVLAIVSKKNLIVFDDGSEITEKFLYKFKRSSYSKLNYVVEDFNSPDFDFDMFKSNYNDRGLNSVVFVSDKDTILSDDFLEDLNYYSLFVEFNESNLKYGSIKFTDKLGTRTYNYYDIDESMTLQTMAIFSKPEVFDCSYKLLFKKVEPVYAFYINKTNYYLDKINFGENICLSNSFIKGDYSNFNDLLINFSQTLINDYLDNISIVDEKLGDIETFHRRDFEVYNCPLIY